MTRLFGGQGAAARALPASGSPPPYLGVASSPLSAGDSAACLVPEGREAMRKESGGARGGGGLGKESGLSLPGLDGRSRVN